VGGSRDTGALEVGTTIRVASELLTNRCATIVREITPRCCTSPGMGPEAIAAMKGKLRSKTHVGIVNGLVSQQRDILPQLYYGEVKDQIDGAQRGELASKLTAEPRMRWHSARPTRSDATRCRTTAFGGVLVGGSDAEVNAIPRGARRPRGCVQHGQGRAVARDIGKGR
jgi:hypothetical protein